MIERKTWKEFRESGLLWFINSIPHLFGWCICVDFDNEGNVKEAFPARTKFRGFSEDCNDKGYANVTKYLKENIDKLVEEVEDETETN